MGLQVQSTTISAVKLVTVPVYRDHRGFFSEVYNRAAFAMLGIDIEFVQDNHSFSEKIGTIRGLHFQSEPYGQAKLVRVARGRILDVAVDLRKSSATFGQHVAIEISAENWQQLFVPIGFAHGFCTLEPSTEVIYKVSGYYRPEHDHGLAYNDPELGISWPVGDAEAILSKKDKEHPPLNKIPVFFP